MRCAFFSCLALAVQTVLFAGPAPTLDVAAIDRERILRAANAALALEPPSITAHCVVDALYCKWRCPKFDQALAAAAKFCNPPGARNQGGVPADLGKAGKLTAPKASQSFGSLPTNASIAIGRRRLLAI